MNPQKIKENFPLVLLAFSTGLVVAWIIEAFVDEPGVISKYVAPFAILGLLVSTFLTWRQQSQKNRTENKYY